MAATTETTRDVEKYTAAFEAMERADGRGAPAWAAALRRSAIERFAEAGFPTTRQEEWRFTSVAPIARASFRMADPAGGAVSADHLARVAPAIGEAVTLVLVDGRFDAELSSGTARGVEALGLRRALATRPEAVRARLGRLAGIESNPFTALNTAFLDDGLFIVVERGAVVETPVHVVHVSTGGAEPTVRHPRVLIAAEDGSQVRLVESYVGLGDGAAFTNAVTEIGAGESASVDHYRLEREGAGSYHVARLEVVVGANGAYRLHTFTFGGLLARYDMNVRLDGPGADAILNGLYVLDEAQHVDHHTGIDHAKPHGTSHELFKGILSGRSMAVFNGRILVRPGAQKTDSKQTNKNLLLSGDALVQTNPQLEIYADDVKCTHGATIGQIDDEALFYLRSRGIPASAAAGILTYAFAAEIVDGVRIEPLRRALHGWIRERFRGAER